MSDFFTETFGYKEFYQDLDKNRAALAEKATFRGDTVIGNWQHCDFAPAHEGDAPIKGGIFRFDTVAELRKVAFDMLKDAGYTTIDFAKDHTSGDSRELHSQHPNAFFQAASQFNCLEFVSPNVTPEYGITIYQNDRTQGPACAIACAAATAFRNYLAPVNSKLATDKGWRMPEPTIAAGSEPVEKYGQNAGKQYNGLADLEPLVWEKLGNRRLWNVQNGYIELAECGKEFMNGLRIKVRQTTYEQELIDTLRVGCQFDSEVTDVRNTHHRSDATKGTPFTKPVTVGQVFASACSIGYSQHDEKTWAPLAKIVLKAAYEATFYAYIIHCLRLERLEQKPGPLMLTKLGGGVFANPAEWINEAMEHAQARSELLFASLRAEPKQPVRAAPTEQPPVKQAFKLTALVTHFRGVESGYDGFITAGPKFPTPELVKEEYQRVPSFPVSIGLPKPPPKPELTEEEELALEAKQAEAKKAAASGMAPAGSGMAPAGSGVKSASPSGLGSATNSASSGLPSNANSAGGSGGVQK